MVLGRRRGAGGRGRNELWGYCGGLGIRLSFAANPSPPPPPTRGGGEWCSGALVPLGVRRRRGHPALHNSRRGLSE